MCRLFTDIGEIVADEFRQLTSYTKYSAVGCVLSLLFYHFMVGYIQTI